MLRSRFMVPATGSCSAQTRSRFGGLLAVGAMLATVTVLVPVTEVERVDATHCGAVTPNDSGLVNLPSACRNFIVDLAPGTLLDRQRLLQSSAAYLGNGFTENFLWYSRQEAVTITDSTQQWSSCNVFPSSTGGVCPSNQFHFTPILNLFHTSSVTLSAFRSGGSMIFLGCGNTSSTEIVVSKPVPTIRSAKFHDVNRNGVRDVDEAGLAGWRFDLVRMSSEAGVNQPPGHVASTISTGTGEVVFALDGIGPGIYEVVEIGQPGWRPTTPASIVTYVGFGIGNTRIDVPAFGNTETQADIAKSSFSVVNPPIGFDVRTPTELTVEVTLENLGPALEVDASDEILAILPPDCVVNNPRRTILTRLRRGQPVTRRVSYMVTCERPSFHELRFDDVLTLAESTVVEINLANNTATASVTIPVTARTDLSTTAQLSCATPTNVGVTAVCVATIGVTNNGFGSVDATSETRLATPADCVAQPKLGTLSISSIGDGETRSNTLLFNVTCSRRSFHEFDVSTAVKANDIHVIDTNNVNNIAGAGPSTIEVFQAANLQPTRAHLSCSETLGATSFSCTASIDVINHGPAPDVHTVAYAVLSRSAECVVMASRRLEQDITLAIDIPRTLLFTWNISCPASAVLHPFKVTTDLYPAADEPHVVDIASPISDEWVVPYCVATVNPHGQREPQAPGSGMNEDGFYIFGTLPNELGESVYIRDNGSGVVFGPFQNGTRVKYVEANGSIPTIRRMAGNNGNGQGQATAVYYEIRGRGDAEALFVDETGIQVIVTCLVPPFPK